MQLALLLHFHALKSFFQRNELIHASYIKVHIKIGKAHFVEIEYCNITLLPLLKNHQLGFWSIFAFFQDQEEKDGDPRGRTSKEEGGGGKKGPEGWDRSYARIHLSGKRFCARIAQKSRTALFTFCSEKLELTADFSYLDCGSIERTASPWDYGLYVLEPNHVGRLGLPLQIRYSQKVDVLLPRWQTNDRPESRKEVQKTWWQIKRKSCSRQENTNRWRWNGHTSYGSGDIFAQDLHQKNSWVSFEFVCLYT